MASVGKVRIGSGPDDVVVIIDNDRRRCTWIFSPRLPRRREFFGSPLRRLRRMGKGRKRLTSWRA